MKTSIFDMNFVLPPLVEMTEVEKDMATGVCTLLWIFSCQENNMKTSIFDMKFVLPPLVEMTEVEKDMPENTGWRPYYNCQENT